MWSSILRAANWTQIRELLSSEVAEVLPKRRLASYATRLGRNYMSSSRYQQALDARRGALDASSLSVEIPRGPEGESPTVDTSVFSTRPEDGELLLQLYFHQLYTGDWTLLDIRRPAFGRWREGGDLLWAPGPFFVKWDVEFIESIRGIYEGFYGGDDELFEASLQGIGMGGMSGIFREHFGFGGQQEVEFRTDDFQKTFSEVLRVATSQEVRIHPDFVGRGIYLTALYEHLEELGGAYDVAAAYHAARRSASCGESAASA